MGGSLSLGKTIEAVAKREGMHGDFGAAHTLNVTRSEEDRPSSHASPETNAMAAEVLDKLLPKNNVLAGQIGRLLVAEEQRRVTHRESAGRLDRRALTRMRVGALDVYSRRQDTPGINTAVLLLIDGSGSMNASTGMSVRRGRIVGSGPTRSALAQTTAWHIAKAAELAGARVCIGVFYSKFGGTGARILVLKDWHETTRNSAAQIASARALTSTALSPAILKGADMLCAQAGATRRILMAITDGECDMGAKAVTKACTLAADQDVEVVGIGMDCASVTAAFPPRYSINVQDLRQLAAAGLGALVSMLEDTASC
jgi:Mg-chelatase subunit ChlD